VWVGLGRWPTWKWSRGSLLCALCAGSDTDRPRTLAGDEIFQAIRRAIRPRDPPPIHRMNGPCSASAHPPAHHPHHHAVSARPRLWQRCCGGGRPAARPRGHFGIRASATPATRMPGASPRASPDMAAPSTWRLALDAGTEHAVAESSPPAARGAPSRPAGQPASKADPVVPRPRTWP